MFSMWNIHVHNMGQKDLLVYKVSNITHHTYCKNTIPPMTRPSLQVAFALHALLGHLGVELTALLALASRGKVTREHGLGHKLLLLLLMVVMVANGDTGTSRGIRGLREEGEREGEGERGRERERESERER